MPQALTAGLPPYLSLGAGYIIRVNAIDPTTGANVGGVKATDVSIYVRNLGDGAPDELQFGPFMLVPGPGA